MASKRRKSTRKRKAPSPGLGRRWREFCRSDFVSALGPKLGRLVLLGLLVAATAAGFGYLERYVRQVTRDRAVALKVELQDPPKWAGQELISQICLATGIRRNDDLTDKSLVQRWQKNLLGNPWVKDIRLLRKRYDGLLQIDCELRQPIASIREGSALYYVDAEGVVLPSVPLEGSAGHLVRLQGADFADLRPGSVIQEPAVQAGIDVLAQIRRTDEKLTWQDRIWQELAVMDVSNYEGRLSQVDSHLVMYTTNHTEIRWGAALGRSRPYYEAPMAVKLENLYRSYKRFQSLGAYEFVDLRYLRKEKADPLRQSKG
ncbi:MAG: hypothetical protein JW810_12345 [Sedimentisphaerales bacterium]|nr:hypothetical protein [Sedimentisphaerales bacterium]